MPRKRITFIVIPPNDGQVQEFRLSARLVWIAGLICIVFVGALGFYASDYYTRADQKLKVVQLAEENHHLLTGLTRAETKVDDLAKQMSRLLGDDEKLRA